MYRLFSLDEAITFKSSKSTGFFRRPIIIQFNTSFGTEREVTEGTRDKLKDPLITSRIIQNELDIIFTWA